MFNSQFYLSQNHYFLEGSTMFNVICYFLLFNILFYLLRASCTVNWHLVLIRLISQKIIYKTKLIFKWNNV